MKTPVIPTAINGRLLTNLVKSIFSKIVILALLYNKLEASERTIEPAITDAI